jgi:hypothetical protein
MRHVRNTQFGRDAEALIQKIRQGRSDNAVSINRWRVAAAAVAALLLLGWIGLFVTGIPLSQPWAVHPNAREHVEQASLAPAQEEERNAKAVAEAEARAKAEQAEKERLAAAKAEGERQAKAAADAETKRKAAEAEQQRLKEEEERQGGWSWATLKAYRESRNAVAPIGGFQVVERPRSDRRPMQVERDPLGDSNLIRTIGGGSSHDQH